MFRRWMIVDIDASLLASEPERGIRRGTTGMNRS